MLDTETGEWLGTNGPETSNHGSNGQYHNQPNTRRFHHAAAPVGSIIYIYGGLRDGNLEICKEIIHFCFSYFSPIDFAYLSTGQLDFYEVYRFHLLEVTRK